MIREIPCEVVAWVDEYDWSWRMNTPLLGAIVPFLVLVMDAPGPISFPRTHDVDIARLIVANCASLHKGLVTIRADFVTYGRPIDEPIQPDNWRRVLELRWGRDVDALDNVQTLASWLGEPLSRYDEALRWNAPHARALMEEYDRLEARHLLPRPPTERAIIDDMTATKLDEFDPMELEF